MSEPFRGNFFLHYFCSQLSFILDEFEFKWFEGRDVRALGGLCMYDRKMYL